MALRLSNSDLEALYSKITTEPLFVVVYQESTRWYIESPDEQGLGQFDQVEGLARIFLTEEEATAYALAVQSYCPEDLGIIKMSVDFLTTMLQYSVSQETTVPARVDVSTVRMGEWPTGIETLWSHYATVH
ncbi:hypothetical protein UFOVP75_109 [uncultured Caudovirales phage]|uniref:Uncharacterized protein n=1 Tax=uncultured Caudovirales phage TaxID=2100421 RepID=A0A6J5L219_9CAUD|nr:hypothetical protein UFOVP75_109 [uncultured Caudovirales phage]